MIIRTLDREHAISLFEEIKKDPNVINSEIDKLDPNYKEMRKKIIQINNSINAKDYQYDLEFSSKFYEMMNSYSWFNETVAGNYGFWYYVCLKVAPDVIMRRHGLVKEYYYYKQVRMYFPCMWWYFHMSFQGNVESTKEMLKVLTTDYILNLCERPGNYGFYLDVTRKIMKYICLVPKEIRNKLINKRNLFRRVMIQNTAQNPNFNLVVENRADDYVKGLFLNCKVKVDDYEQ